MRKKESKGYIYFLKCNEFVKIGRTKSMKDRMYVYSVQSPFESELIHSIETNDCIKLEKHFHKVFDKKRVKGEWFRLSNKDMKEICLNWYNVSEDDLQRHSKFIIAESKFVIDDSKTYKDISELVKSIA